MTAADHKRKSRPIAPATVTVDADSITIVVPDVLGKNESHVAGREGARHTSTATKRYRASVAAGVNEWRSTETTMCIVDGRMSTVCDSQAMDGAWRLEVLAVWPRQRSTIAGRPVDFGTCPMGDADAAIPQALDALQHAGVLDDDARVIEVRAWSMWSKDRRMTIIRLIRVADRGVHMAKQCGHLIDIARDNNSAAEEPAKPRTKAARRRAKETT